MSDELGTPIKCKNCGYETTVRLTRGTRIKNILCTKCGGQGFKRNTYYDKGEGRFDFMKEKEVIK